LRTVSFFLASGRWQVADYLFGVGIPPSNANVQTCVADFPAQFFSYVEGEFLPAFNSCPSLTRCVNVDTQQINVANSTWCLGIGEYNFPEIQQCVPGDKAQAWVMKY
jgi:hypothetical protein